MRDRLERSIKASYTTMEGRYQALQKSKYLEDLVFVAFYAGKVSATADIMRRECGDISGREKEKTAWDLVRDAIAMMEG